MGLVALLGGLLGCRSGNSPLGDSTGPTEDLAPLQRACEKDSIRCSADRSRAEVCDGDAWVKKADCDAEKGELCDSGVCARLCDEDRLPRGNVGCTFYPANLWSTSTSGRFGIVASNTSDRLPARVTLSDANGMVAEQVAMPGSLVTFKLDHNLNKLLKTEQAKKSFVLTSTAPVAVYQFHPIDAAQVFSGSATLLLPEHVMARKYFVTSYTYNEAILTSPPQGQGFVAVTAMEDDTDVTITFPVATASGPGVAGVPAGSPLRRTLSRLEVLEVIQANSEEDITGATVVANKRVVVFGGAGGVTVPRTAVGGNHFGVQMFPLQTWGKHYVAAKFKRRNSTDEDYYRVVASENSTHVTLQGAARLPTIPELKSGQFYEFATAEHFELLADKPVLVMQHMVAWGNLSGRYDREAFPDGVSKDCPFVPPRQSGADDVRCLGDANLAPLVPVEQYRSDYIFYVPETYTYDFVNVTAPSGTRLLLDGMAVMDPLQSIGATPLGQVTLRLRPGNHRLSGSAPLGLIGYGYSYATSYSYVGGLNLERINPVE